MFSISLINSLYCAVKERKEILNEKFIRKVHTELGACKREEIKILMDFRLCCRMQHNFYFAKHILVCDWRGERGKDREWEGNKFHPRSKAAVHGHRIFYYERWDMDCCQSRLHWSRLVVVA